MISLSSISFTSLSASQFALKAVCDKFAKVVLTWVATPLLMTLLGCLATFLLFNFELLKTSFYSFYFFCHECET